MANSRDVRAKLQDGSWVSARRYQINAFNDFMNFPNLGINPFEYDNHMTNENKIKFTIKREHGQKNYLVREDQTNSAHPLPHSRNGTQRPKLRLFTPSNGASQA